MALALRARRCALALAAFALLMALVACQGSSQGVTGPAPRSRLAAGDQQQLPPEEELSQRQAIDQSGGAVAYRRCKLTVPVGALSETLFIQVGEPATPPKDVIAETGYQIDPDGIELLKDALLAISYYDDDIPAGKLETDLVIVHAVNNVWVELSNSKVHPYNNTVEAPIRYLGLYALRLASEDPRRMNTAPEAIFEFSTEPYPAQLSTPIDEAQKQIEAENSAKAKKQAGSDAETGAGTAPAPGQEPGATPPVTGPGVGATPAPKSNPAPLAMILERRVIAGPDDGKAPADAPAGKDNQKDESAGAAENVAEGASPAKGKGGGEEPVAEKKALAIPDTTIYFNASASRDPDGTIVQYDWDFNCDGVFDYTSHETPYAKHTFKQNGDYTVVLKVSDNGRYTQSGYGTQVVSIRNPKAEPGALAANISAYPPFGPCPLTTNFAATVTGGTAPYTFRWGFSDGSESTLANPHTTYPEIGSHTITFKVTDITGETLSGSVAVQSLSSEHPGTPQPRMLMDISPTNTRGYAPLLARFDLLTERATEPVTYRVSFGDEAAGEDEQLFNTASLQHTYTTAGFYLLKVIATDADLRTASTFATVHISAPEAGARDFVESEAGVGGDPFSFGHEMRISVDYVGAKQNKGGRTVRFSVKSPPHDGQGVGYQWDFGDGNFSTEPQPEHTYAKDGVYEVRLTASDSEQRWRHRVWLPVSAEPAVAIQRPAWVEGPAPLRLNLDAIVTRGEQPFRYDWFIGDVRRSDPSAFYTFQLPGEYKVRLDVYDKYNQPMHSPEITVRVRDTSANYRQPLAVVEPISGSTRALVVDYTAAYPLPLTSPNVEGAVNLVDISADGQYLAAAGKEGFIVKRIASGEPVTAFLPASGELRAISVLESGAAYCSVESSGGVVTYLVRPTCDVLRIGEGMLEDASGDGGVLILKQRNNGPSPAGEPAAPLSLYSVDVGAGKFGEPQGMGSHYEAQLSRDGHTAFLINSEMRLVQRQLGGGADVFLSGGDDLKHGLVVAGDGTALAFVSQRGDRKSVIYGRETNDGEFPLASVTDQTGFRSESLGLSADGRFLLAYGSRKELTALLSAASGKAVGDDAVAAENAASEKGVPPTQRRDRLGIIRLDLSAAPADWNITKVSPKFIVEAAAQFAVAGPF